MSYKGPMVEGPRPPRCQKDVNPLALCRIASADGVQPLNMTSFLWIQRDQSVAKIVCHSTSRRNVPPPSDRQKASSEVATRRPTPVSCHTVWANGQTKNKCWQSSTALAHSGHSTGAFGTKRCSRDLIISRRCSRSQANTLIFRGRRRFHTTGSNHDVALEIIREEERDDIGCECLIKSKSKCYKMPLFDLL